MVDCRIVSRMIAAAALVVICGCNVMSWPENQKAYALSVEQQRLAQEAARHVKKYVNDPLAVDRARTLYEAAAFEANSFLEMMQRMVATGAVDEDFYDKAADTTNSFEYFMDFIKLAGDHSNGNAIATKGGVLSELDAGAESKAAVNQLTKILNDKKIDKAARTRTAVALMEKNRWLDWKQL